MVRWFIIVGLLLALLVGGLVGFNAFRSQMIAQFFANNKPPPIDGHGCRGQVRSDSEPADGGRRSRRRASGQRHLRCQRPHHRHHVHRRRHREGGRAAGAIVRCARAGRSRELQGAGHGGAAGARPRQAAGVAPVRPAGDGRYRRRRPTTRPAPASPRPRRSFRRSWCVRRSTASSACARSRSASFSPPARRSCR